MDTDVIDVRAGPADVAMFTDEVRRVYEALAHLPEEGSPVAWVREDAGLVGWGVAATVEVSGPDRFERAAAS